MMKLVVFISFVTCVFGAVIPEGMLPQLDGRIVGGTSTTISQFPYQISLLLYGQQHCGGSIISERIVLTAAHCTINQRASNLRIRAGSSYVNSGGVTIDVANIINHADYNADTMVNDIAVINLSSSLSFNSNIRSIALASSTPANGASAVVTGWGRISSGGSVPDQLQMARVNIILRPQCSDNYDYNYQIKQGMICASALGKDSCQGDSGGPLASNGLLVGVVSWGYGCGFAFYPGVYTEVAHFRSWIISNS